jgi:hypothetical protein
MRGKAMKNHLIIAHTIAFGYLLLGVSAHAGFVSFKNNTPNSIIGLGYKSKCGVWPSYRSHEGPITKIKPGEEINRDHTFCSFSNIVVIVEKDGKDEVLYSYSESANNIKGFVIFDSPSGRFIPIINVR